MTIPIESVPVVDVPAAPVVAASSPSASTPGPDHLAEKPSIKPVPKVAAVGVGGVALVVVVAILSGIAPGTFDSLGVWGPVVTAAVTALALFLSGYIKKA